MATAFHSRKAIEFYTIELAQLADNSFRVSVTATTVDDEEPQLLGQEIATETVSSIGGVLELIKNCVTG